MQTGVTGIVPHSLSGQSAHHTYSTPPMCKVHVLHPTHHHHYTELNLTALYLTSEFSDFLYRA